MLFFETVQADAALSAVQTATQTAAAKPAEQCDYSIRYFFDWHQKIFHDLIDWVVQNAGILLISAVWFMIIIALCFAILLLIRKVAVPLVEKKHKNLSLFLMETSGPVVWLVFLIGLSFSIDFISLPSDIHKIIDKIFYVCFTLSLLSIIRHALQSAANQMIIRFKRKNPENYNMNKLMLDFSMSIIRLVLWIILIIFILQEVFHLKVTHLIASAGILGLAIAFAAKDTISNIFGAFFILCGKMFRVGDAIKAGSTEGIVEQIGFRSIQIRAFSDGRLIDIPNHIIADSQIENYSTRLYWREQISFGLVYQTTPEQIAIAKKILTETGRDLSDLLVEGKPVQFDLLLLDNSSINLSGYVWFKASDIFTKNRSQGLFNEEVFKRFSEAGIEFAYPTTSVFLENTGKK